MVLVRQKGGAWETDDNGLRVARGTVSWADVDARDPAVGIPVATIAASEIILSVIVALLSPMTGPDAENAYAELSTPGQPFSDDYMIAVNNAAPKDSNSESQASGAVIAAFGTGGDPMDLTGGVFVYSLLIQRAG